jgi:hypothetical protein
MRTTLLLIPLLLLGATPNAASAGSGWHVGVEAVTEIPVQVGARVAVEAPYRIRIDSSVGFFPPVYLDLMNDILSAAPQYNEDVATLVKIALDSSIVWRTHVGWRPFSGAGFYFTAGYGLITFGGDAGAEELLIAATELQLIDSSKPAPEEGSLPEKRGYDIVSMLHMIDAEVGWEFLIAERLTLRAAVGGAFTLAASTDISPRFDVRRPVARATIDEFTSQSGAALNDLYTTFVHTPVVSLSLGYRFM